MKKLLFAIAGAAAFSAFAADPSAGANDISLVGFENYTADQTVIGYGDNGQEGGSLWSCVGDDASLVKAYGGENAAVPAITEPRPFAGETNTKYLNLDTNGSELQRTIPSAGQSVAADGTYVDTLVQFTPSESAPGADDLTSAKLAIWLGVENNVTNLCVQGAYYDTTDGGLTLDATSNQVYKLNKSCDPNTWYRLTVKAISTIGNAAAGTDYYPGFVILIDGEEIATSTAVYSSDALTKFFAPTAEGAGGADDYLDADNLALLKSGKFIPSLDSTRAAATLTAVGFKGTGALDDFVVTTEQPDLTPAGIDFTLTWPTGFTPVSYTIDGGTPVLIDGNTTFPIQVADGAVVAFTFTNADGATKTMTATASSSVNEIDASTATYVWADYLGDAVAGAYTIDDANDLDMLRKGVAANLATLGETFKQTANIDMTSAGAFAGIGTYNANASAGLPFQGTYDGQGFTISNITFTDRDYAGVFNQVKGGTIKDLTVDTITFPGVGSKCSAAIVGNAGLGTTLQGLTAAGSFGTQANPAKHNVAGIAIRLSGGASNVVDGVVMLETLVKDCTNNATLYGNYTKAAGITALTQDQNGVPNDYVLFDGCVNNGNIVMVNGTGTEGRDGVGGIVGYVSDGTKIKDCVNNGTFTSVLANAKIGGIVGWAQGRTLDDLGGNKNPAAAKMIGDPVGSTITGFYATVDNGVATTVAALAKDTTYLLERNVPTNNVGEAEFTLTAVGDTISFDTALGYTFEGTVASSGAAGIPVASTSGTVITYSAGYFPRTATAGQDGSAANPFEIADEDDLLALQAAVANDVGRNLAYVQVADIALTAAWEGIGMKGGKDHVSEAAYDAEAFTGVYDGGNYTISNFLMENGTDYGALFNSIYNATIKNLKLSWGSSTLCANSSASGGDTGASFVGVAKASTLQNLTTVAGTVTTVSASKDFGGIVGYLMAGSTVESCTNALNVASLKGGRKCGGIAIITQGGTGTAVLRNCKNSGTSAGGAQDGGIVGYIGVATEIDGCENTAAVQLFKFQSGSVTASGVNKGNATVRSSDASVAGLRFATVDGDVATFVADNALALNGEYKVMATGATATFAFAEAGTIAFDTALFTPTWAVTAAEGLTLTDATEGTVKTYTATAPQPAYPTYLTDADADVKAAYDTWKVANGADTESAYENQFLVNAAPATTVSSNALAITAIEQNETAGWDITVECTVQGVDLTGTVGTAKAGNGYLAVSYAADLTGPWTTENINITAVANGKVTVNVNKSGAKFMKVKLSSKAEPQN